MTSGELGIQKERPEKVTIGFGAWWKKSSRTGWSRFFICLGVQLAANYTFVKFEHQTEDWQIMALLRKLSFELQSNALTPSSNNAQSGRSALRNPVVIIDSSRLRRRSPTDNDSPIWRNASDITPREKLTELMVALAEYQPAAIGFDIDLSRSDKIAGWNEATLTAELRFFDQALAFTKVNLQPTSRGEEIRQPVDPDYPQVYFGVGRRAPDLIYALATGAEQIFPFVDPKYSVLGALILAKGEVYLGSTPSLVILPRQISLVTPNVTTNSADTPAAQGLAARLATAYERYHGLTSAARSSRFFNPTVTHTQVLPGEKHSATSQEFFVNYSELENVGEIIELEDFLAKATRPNSNLRDHIAGRVVLVGATERELTEDHIVVPGRNETVAGVLAHACGVLTLLKTPLLIPSEHTSLWFGLLFSAITALLFRATLERWRLFRRVFRTEESLELIKIPCVVILVSGQIYLLAKFHIAWPGALAVMVGAGVESAVAIFFLNWIGQEQHPHL